MLLSGNTIRSRSLSRQELSREDIDSNTSNDYDNDLTASLTNGTVDTYTDLEFQQVNSYNKTDKPTRTRRLVRKKKNKMDRSASAYPKDGIFSSQIQRVNIYFRQHGHAMMLTLGCVMFLFLLLSDETATRSGSIRGTYKVNGKVGIHSFGGSKRAGYFKGEDVFKNGGKTLSFAAVTDNDQLSRVTSSSKPLFESIMVTGDITYNESEKKYDIQFDPKTRQLLTKHNEAGRGAEFSELVRFNDRLLAFDDRTGDVFEILNNADASESFCVPRYVITEGDGETDKGMKWEWSTIKRNPQTGADELYMGSMGKEYTRSDGSIENTNNLWVSIMDEYGEFRREDWMDNYNVLRDALGASAPGYVIHEAVNWSEHMKKWFFIPRRVSSEMYDEYKDEKMGTNKIISVDENFKNPKVIDIKFNELDPLHGFSTFAFVPGTNDEHAFAIRSVEEDCVDGTETCKQRSYFCIFNVLTGDVLLDEVKYDLNIKLEGIEFVNVNTKPTAMS